jgi:predicted MFS family arabinose efflux permease
MFNRRELTVLALMCLVHFCLIVDFMVVMPMGPQLMRIYQIDASQFGYLVSIFTLCAGLTGIVGSFWIDRFDRKNILLAIFFCFLMSNLASAFARSFQEFLVARGLTGAFVGVIGSLMLSIVSDLIPIEKRSTAIGIVMSAFAFAAILGVPLCLYLASLFSWQAPFLFLSLFSLLVWIAILVLLPNMNAHLSELPVSFQTSVNNLKNIIGDPSRSRALLFMIFLILGHFSVVSFLFPSIVANSGINETKLPIVYLCGGLGSIMASVMFGRWADRYGRRKVFTIALICSLLPIILVTHLFSQSIFPTIIFVSSFFILMGGRMTPAMTIITSSSHPSTRGSFMSLVSSTQHLAAALASILASQIVVKTADGKISNFFQVGWMAVVFSLIALYLGLKIRSVED